MKTPADVAAAVDAGADAIGFVLAPSSRQVPAALVHRLADGVPVSTYAVTVDLTPDEVEPLLSATGVTGLQPHGAHAVEAATVADGLGLDVLFPVRVDGPVRPGEAGLGFRPLLDTAGTLHGGSGHTFDWDLIDHDGAEFVLAGGLGPDNVAAAIADALLSTQMTLNRGRLIGLWFDRAIAKRTGKAGHIRRIDLRVRARVEDS